MKQRKILHLSNTDINKDSRILKHLEALSKLKGTKLYALGTLMSGTEVKHNKLDFQLKINTYELKTKNLRFLTKPIFYLLNIFEIILVFFFKGIKLKPDIVHCHDTIVLPAGFILKLFLKCKLVYDAHELESAKGGQSKILSLGTILIEKLCWKQIDLFITVSESILNWYKKNFSKKESLVIYNSPKIKKLDQKYNGYLKNKFKIKDDSTVYIYIGCFTNGRGIEEILEIFSKLNYSYHIVFLGYGEKINTIKAYASNFKNIHLHQQVPHDEVVNIATSADVGVCPIMHLSLSCYNAIPTKVLEYMFSKLKIISFEGPEIKKIFKKYKNGKTFKNINDLKSSIIQLKDSNKNRISYDIEDLEEYSHKFQQDSLKKEYSKLLKKR